MSKRNWTDAQSAAISIHGRTLLVSAAAGSGKTATLTERIIRSITDKDSPADISKMLIVTFTRAAATELRDRIFAALSASLADSPADRHLNEQLIKLGSADICTIDAFYLKLIRQNFSSLGIPASARIADTSETDILKATAMNETIDRFYDTEPDFPAFAECFVRTKSIYRLAEPMLDLYEGIICCPEGIEFLKCSADSLRADALSQRDFMSTGFGGVIRSELISEFEYYASVLDGAYEHSESCPDTFGRRAPAYAYDGQFCRSVLEELRDPDVSFERLRDIFISYSPLKMGSVKACDEDEESLFYKNERAKIKDGIKSLWEELFSRSPEQICNEMLLTAKNADMLYALLSDFSLRFYEEKSRRGIMDFDDIKRYTLRLLVLPDGSPTEPAVALRGQYSHIYIDEYQDVDLIQDRIFSAISDNNRFMVGDIKQSIYGFRGAEPRVFAEYKENFRPLAPSDIDKPFEDAEPLTIFMSNNFRCDKNIIEFTNSVCSRLFFASRESIGYTEADDLLFSKPLQNEAYVSPKAEIAVILTGRAEDIDEEDAPKKHRRSPASEAPDKEELEAEYIAQRIAALIGKERLADGELIAPGDIAVLYRSSKMVAYLSEALGKRGILCSEGGGGDYFESPDVLLVLSLLNVVDNPHRDIHLAGTLCSPLFEFTLDELIAIRKSGDPDFSLYDALVAYAELDCPLGEKCRRFDSALSALRSSASCLPVDRFLRILFESDVFVASGLLCDRDDFGEGGNLLRLYDYARTFECGSFKGLYNFIEFINTLIENGKMLEVAPKDRCRERVTLTTMHHSKGLEFPVCFICGTASKKNTRRLSAALLYEYPLGVAMRLSDSTGFARVNTPMRDAIAKSRYLLEIEEEMRILYVALTRARERLYITAVKNSEGERLMSEARMRLRYCCPYVIRRCTSFIDWLLLPFADKGLDIGCARLSFIDASQCIFGASEGQAEVLTEDMSFVEPDSELYASLCEQFGYSYGYSHLRKIPAKLSVSRLSPDILDEHDTSVSLSVTDTRTHIPDFFITGKAHAASAAERGTATHLFFQFCDPKRLEAYGVAEEIARLTEQKFIPENVAELIYRDELEKFLGSELFDRIRTSHEVIREQRFNLLLPADAFAEDAATRQALIGETLAVQGVIDLLLIDENGDIELYDYKTDRLTPLELSRSSAASAKMNASHALQLSYYAKAVELLFGRECRRVCVYSTQSGELYDIDRVALRVDELK